MEALSARPAGVNPPARGYIDCPCLQRHKTMFKKVSRQTQTSKIKMCVCLSVFCAQPAERMRDLGHASRRGRVAGRVRRPGHPCSTIDRQLVLVCAGSQGALVLLSLKGGGGEARTCIRREAGRGTLRGEGLWAVRQQRVEVRHVGVLHHWHIVGLEATRQKRSEDSVTFRQGLELWHIPTLSVSSFT